MQGGSAGGTTSTPGRLSQTGEAEPQEPISGTVLMNGDASGTMVMNSDPAGTVVVDSTDSGGRLGTMAERGEDFAAALRSNAPAESSG